jgi:hypothetical protein
MVHSEGIFEHPANGYATARRTSSSSVAHDHRPGDDHAKVTSHGKVIAFSGESEGARDRAINILYLEWESKIEMKSEEILSLTEHGVVSESLNFSLYHLLSFPEIGVSLICRKSQ